MSALTSVPCAPDTKTWGAVKLPVMVSPVLATAPTSAAESVMSAVNGLELIVRACGTAPISDSDHATSAPPFTDFAVLPMVRVRAVPQFAVVMLPVPSKLVPLIWRAVASLVAVAALPVMVVMLTTPVWPLTEVTASVGVSSSCQLARVLAPLTLRMNVFLTSVRTATSPTWQVSASISVWLATT